MFFAYAMLMFPWHGKPQVAQAVSLLLKFSLLGSDLYTIYGNKYDSPDIVEIGYKMHK